MVDKKALILLKKYYLSYKPEGQLSDNEKGNAVNSGLLVPDSITTHDEIVTEIKRMSKLISLNTVAKAFLYSLSSEDMRYRSALSSLVWARSLPEHEMISNDVEKTEWNTPACIVSSRYFS